MTVFTCQVTDTKDLFASIDAFRRFATEPPITRAADHSNWRKQFRAI